MLIGLFDRKTININEILSVEIAMKNTNAIATSDKTAKLV
jgi:hypothetical protein